MKVLIVDDDINIAEIISLYLKKENFETKCVHDGAVAVQAFIDYQPNVVVLDLMLPHKDGNQVCREIRQISSTPIIMLTAKSDVFDKVLGLELGADDYIVKPFDGKELVARVKAVLRRYELKPEPVVSTELVVDNMKINESTYTVIYHDKQLDLPPKEFELLAYLVKHPNQVFTREKILESIWGYEFMGDTRTVDVHIKRLREKLTLDDSWSIKTVWGIGYKFEENNKNVL